MKTAIATLKSRSPYSQSKHYEDPKLHKELACDYEERTWRSRMHVTSDGHVEIPAASFANCIKDAAKFLSLKVKGGGQTTYTKHFEAGVMVTEGLKLPILASEVTYDRLFVPSEGIPGGGKRVIKLFPRIEEWEGAVEFTILDDIITGEIFGQVLRAAGNIIGIGRFRPRNRGTYGRFTVKDVLWCDEETSLANM